ncbi:MAG: ATP phosphoribosyltransferase regulatory subunit, partial [Clostridia bacterium]|nr:ATP phosphoribosyltransferase regulatory subunit [Clostridia bacterium]
MLDMLCDECANHLEKLKSYLDVIGVEYEIDKGIVRGLDYYTKTVFEIITKMPDGSELTVCGGGRYDGLVQQLGGPEMAGIGFGMGVERILMVQDMLGFAAQAPRLIDAFIVTMGDEARLAGEKIVRQLRIFGIKADLDHCARSMKAQFKYADKLGAAKVIVLAGDELSKGVAKVRDMETHEEAEIPLDEIVKYIKQGV